MVNTDVWTWILKHQKKKLVKNMVHNFTTKPEEQTQENKYKLLNKEYIYKDKKALYPEDLSDYRQIFIDKGLNCFF